MIVEVQKKKRIQTSVRSMVKMAWTVLLYLGNSKIK